MTTQPTQNPAPSESARDLKFNAGKIDEFVTSDGHEYIDRLGGKHRTISGINYEASQAMAAYGYVTMDSFEDGNTLTLPNQVLRHEATGEYYRWGGSLPKVVPAGSTPNSTGGIGPGAWLSVGDAALRSDLAQPDGVELVGGAAKQSDVTSLEGKVSDLENIQGDKDMTASQIAKRMTDGVYPVMSCYGDSTMWGATVGDLGVQSPNNPPAQLGTALNLIYGASFSVNNRAISGTTMRQMMSGTDGSGTTFAQKIGAGGIDQNTTVIYCNHGTNDSQLNGDIVQYRDDLVDFVRICRAAQKVPVLVTPTQCPPRLIIDEAKSKRLYNYVKTMRDVSEKMAVDLVDQFHLFEASANIYRIEQIFPDGIHLSEDAYRQAGFNLAIPLVSCRTVTNEGEHAGLENVSYFDNFTADRQIQYQGSRTGAIITASNSVELTGMNYPVIFGKGQCGVSFIGLQWADAARCVATRNNHTIGIYDNNKQYGSQGAIDWDSEHRFWSPIFAGLSIFGVNFDQSNPGGTGFTFAGVAVPPVQQRLFVSATAGETTKGIIDSGIEVVTLNADLGAGKVLMFSDKGDFPVLSIEITSGAVTAKLFKNGTVVATQSGGSAVTNGIYPVSLQFSPSLIQINVGAIGFTMETTRRLPNIRPYSAYTSCDCIAGTQQA